MTFRCPEVERFVDAYIDGEFSDEDRVALEAHLAGCPGCAQRVRAQARWKDAVQRAAPRPRPSAEMRAQLSTALATEAAEARSPVRRVAFLAVPAAAAVVVGFLSLAPRPSPVADDVIAKHLRVLPLEVQGEGDVVRAWFERKVDFAVRPPRVKGAALVGARLANVRDRQAAYLVYDRGGERISVFVFDPGDLALRGAHRRQIGGHEVYFEGGRGTHVALFRDGGLGYAVTGDMDEDRMIELISTSMQR